MLARMSAPLVAARRAVTASAAALAPARPAVRITPLARSFIIRTLDDVRAAGNVKESDTGTWESRRYLLRKDGMGFSFHETILRAGQSTLIWYRNHVEAVLIVEGEGEIEIVTPDQREGEGVVHQLKTGSVRGRGIKRSSARHYRSLDGGPAAAHQSLQVHVIAFACARDIVLTPFRHNVMLNASLPSLTCVATPASASSPQFYGLDGNERHFLRASPDGDMRVVCAFNPPVAGDEDHNEHGVYPAVDDAGNSRYHIEEEHLADLFKPPTALAKGTGALK